MAARQRRRPGRSVPEIYTIVYYGKANRFILSEEIRANGIEDAEFRARSSLPAGAVTYKVFDALEETRRLTGLMAEEIGKLTGTNLR